MSQKISSRRTPPTIRRVMTVGLMEALLLSKDRRPRSALPDGFSRHSPPRRPARGAEEIKGPPPAPPATRPAPAGGDPPPPPASAPPRPRRPSRRRAPSTPAPAPPPPRPPRRRRRRSP